MAIKTLYPNDQTKRAVVSAYQGGTTVIGWVLQSTGAGVIYNPAWPTGDKLRLIPNVSSTLSNLAPSAGLLVMGNSGIAITSGMTQDTTRGLLSDDYVASQYLQGVTFTSGTVIGQ